MENIQLVLKNLLEGYGQSTFWLVVGLFLSIVLGLAVGYNLKFTFGFLARRCKDSRPIWTLILQGIARVAPFLAVSIGLFLGLSYMELGPAEEFLMTASSVLLSLAVATLAFSLVEAFTLWLVRRVSSHHRHVDDMLVQIVSKSLKVLIVVLAVAQIAQILSGKEISAIVAGLGIGGLAFALAAQDTIKNFFGSIVLLADKPFKVNDRIKIDGNYDGLIEEAGLRSTRIRSLDGHLTTIPNGEMANKVIENISKRPFIKRKLELGLTYNTTPNKIKEAKSILEALLHEHAGSDPEFPPRVYFSDFNASALTLTCTYWFHPADYWQYMEFSEALNFEILEKFNSARIEFAFPTQTIHLNHSQDDGLNKNIL